MNPRVTLAPHLSRTITSHHQPLNCANAKLRRHSPQRPPGKRPVLAPGPLPVPQLQVSELAFLRIGGEAGEPVAVDVGEPQLRARVRAFPADDDPHPGRPAVQVQQAGDVRHPGAVADLAIAVIGRRPRICGDLADRIGDGLGDGHADGVVQPPGLRGQPGEELVRAAA